MNRGYAAKSIVSCDKTMYKPITDGLQVERTSATVILPGQAIVGAEKTASQYPCIDPQDMAMSSCVVARVLVAYRSAAEAHVETPSWESA